MAEENNNKLTYEQLYEFAKQTSEQNEVLMKQLREQRLGEVVAQLNFLFKVIELKEVFPDDYVKKSIDEIQRILVINDDEQAVEAKNPTEKAEKKVKARK